jgi:hypothetical protein
LFDRGVNSARFALVEVSQRPNRRNPVARVVVLIAGDLLKNLALFLGGHRRFLKPGVK